jgi:hypothetical protein
MSAGGCSLASRRDNVRQCAITAIIPHASDGFQNEKQKEKKQRS